MSCTSDTVNEEGARIEVFMVVKIEFTVFWVVALCSVMVGYQHYGGPHCPNHQPSSWRQHSPPKCWYPTTMLHGASTQKTTNSSE